jgi:hypothetical protein
MRAVPDSEEMYRTGEREKRKEEDEGNLDQKF